MRKFRVVKSHILKTQKLKKCVCGVKRESKIPRSILVHDLVGNEIYIQSNGHFQKLKFNFNSK